MLAWVLFLASPRALKLHHKPQVPASLALAVKSKEDLAADAAERAEMKRLVLQASQRDDDSSDVLSTEGLSKEAGRGRGYGHGGRGYSARGGGRAQSARGAIG